MFWQPDTCLGPHTAHTPRMEGADAHPDAGRACDDRRPRPLGVCADGLGQDRRLCHSALRPSARAQKGGNSWVSLWEKDGEKEREGEAVGGKKIERRR